jgi:hypothetical protein
MSSPLAASPRVRQTLLVCLSAWLLLGLWALLVPPYQVPDEVQHAMRTTSVLQQPWGTADDSFIVDQRFTNPMTRNAGPQLGKLFFNGVNCLLAPDIDAMKARRWDEFPIGPEVRQQWAAASYPTLYHLAVFAIAQPVTSLFGLTPYQSTYVFRLASVLIAGALWGLVYLVLERQVGARAAASVLAFVAGIPMLVFASAGVNPDAAALPLSAAAILASWRLGRTGQGVVPAGGLLLAAALTKPTALPVIVAVAAAGGGAWCLGGFRRRPALLVVAAAMAALAAAYAVFYAWSPPRFYGSPPLRATFLEWAGTLRTRAADLWIGYWGWLGWLDYRLPKAWYGWLLPIVGVNVALAAGWLARHRDALFLPLVTAALAVVLCIGEFVYLPQTGYNLQGRHFLVGVLGLAPLVLHDRVWASRLLLVYLAVMHVRFVWETFLRYYGGDAAVLWAALPFH